MEKQDKTNKKNKHRRVIKATTAIVLTIIAVAVTAMAVGFNLRLIHHLFDGNATVLFLVVFFIVVIFYVAGLVVALVTHLSVFALFMANKQNPAKGIKAIYFINLVNLLAYIPLAIIFIRRLQHG